MVSAKQLEKMIGRANGIMVTASLYCLCYPVLTRIIPSDRPNKPGSLQTNRRRHQDYKRLGRDPVVSKLWSWDANVDLLDSKS